jgi:hypothetical protein
MTLRFSAIVKRVEQRSARVIIDDEHPDGTEALGHAVKRV